MTARSNLAELLADPGSSAPAIITKLSFDASLAAEPEYGMAPLSVDFEVTLANPPGSLSYQWNFGDGTVPSLPGAAFMPHLYRQPGTYVCSLTLTDLGGSSTTVFTTIIVAAPGS
jgi:PKD repeat protein